VQSAAWLVATGQLKKVMLPERYTSADVAGTPIASHHISNRAAGAATAIAIMAPPNGGCGLENDLGLS
jgi:hypothetical protein